MKQADYTFNFQLSEESVYAFAAAPGGIVFAACSAGLYRSLDSGCSWDRQPASAEQVMTTVAVSPCFATDRSVFAAVKGGILRSSDAGETWFTTAFPVPPPLFSSLAISPDFERDGIVIASTLEDGVFSSTDRGVHWQPWNFGLFDLNVLCLAISPQWRDDETVYAGTETGIYRSGNGGRAWRITGFPTEFAPVLCMATLMDPDTCMSRLIVGTETHGLHASYDQGETWQGLAPDLLSAAVNQIHVACKSDARSPMYILVDDRIMRSDDHGDTWVAVQEIEGVPTAMLILDDAILLGVLGKGIMRITLG